MTGKSTARGFMARRDDMKQAVARAMRVVERRNTIPLLDHVEINTDDKGVFVAGTDMDVYIRAYLPAAERFGDKRVLVNGHRLHHLMRTGWGEMMTISQKGNKVSVDVDPVKGTLHSCTDIDAVEDVIPRMTLGPAVGTYILNAADLRKALVSVFPAISKEETRYYLNGVHLCESSEDGSFKVAATDGHRMALVRLDFTDIAPEGSKLPIAGMIIPTKAITTLLAMIDKKGDVKMTVHDGDTKPDGKVGAIKATFSADGWDMITKLIDGTFPSYEKVIPKIDDGRHSRTLIHAGRFGRALDVLPPTSDKSIQGIAIMPIGDKSITISRAYPGEDDLKITTACIESEPPGGDIPQWNFRIGINRKYVLQAMPFFPGNIEFFASDVSSPMVLRDADDASRMMILMPMRV